MGSIEMLRVMVNNNAHSTAAHLTIFGRLITVYNGFDSNSIETLQNISTISESTHDSLERIEQETERMHQSFRDYAQAQSDHHEQVERHHAQVERYQDRVEILLEQRFSNTQARRNSDNTVTNLNLIPSGRFTDASQNNSGDAGQTSGFSDDRDFGTPPSVKFRDCE